MVYNVPSSSRPRFSSDDPINEVLLAVISPYRRTGARCVPGVIGRESSLCAEEQEVTTAVTSSLVMACTPRLVRVANSHFALSTSIADLMGYIKRISRRMEEEEQTGGATLSALYRGDSSG